MNRCLSIYLVLEAKYSPFGEFFPEILGLDDPLRHEQDMFDVRVL